MNIEENEHISNNNLCTVRSEITSNMLELSQFVFQEIMSSILSISIVFCCVSNVDSTRKRYQSNYSIFNFWILQFPSFHHYPRSVVTDWIRFTSDHREDIRFITIISGKCN